MVKNKYKSDDKKYPIRVNERIRWSPVRVVSDGENLGIIPTKDALAMARNKGLDLVEISPNSRPPVCRIMDYGKYKYEKSISDKKQKQNQKSSKQKEIKLSPSIDSHDLETKINTARKFLEGGQRVQFKLVFHKRQIAHKDRGFEVMKKTVEQLSDVGTASRQPKLEGRVITCVIESKD